ncbi:ferric reductase-like transmembrane domain-containing protein [Candidatus Finniella inopinata]|uniref:Ferric oxidoreductase domain-containing protein n=1 Tax=Candidatus Finniella inopinata TaxID=1696036 RepID=A0A4Q7DIZ7_9PROT|nr:ferric reductase-like transmembrane domain-containing protein [Candidatus Finniella inopinata]RZI46961.1 hypothetical protein EQU50_01685 [Candidatus Finniella inopinata]
MREAVRNFIPKNRIWILTQLPAVVMGMMLTYNGSQWELLTPYSAYFAVSFLVLTLSLNPIKKLKPQWVWVLKLNRHRRQLGVASFSCALIHFVCFLIMRGSFYKAVPYFFHPAIIPGVWVAFPILLVLAISSNNRSVKKLTFPKWKQLHRTVYLAEGVIIVHMILMGEFVFALCFFVPLVGLQLLRFKNTPV